MPRSVFAWNVAAVFVAAAATAAGARPAAAQEGLMSRDCGTENLIANRAPWAYQDVRGSLTLPTDGAVAPEGAQWDAPPAITFDTPAGSLTYDLGAPTAISSFSVQADANDSYKIFGSLDGAANSFKLIAEIDSVVNIGHGLRTRTLIANPTTVRYVRIGEPLGDNFYSISEFGVYCRAPEPFPPKLRVVDAPQARVVEQPWWKFAWWENDASSRVEMGIAFAALALVGWGLWLTRQGRPSRFQKLRDRLLMVVGAVAFLAYWNFGSFHFGNYLHIWDTYHYYIGSKYFPELSYDRLYECASVADSEDPALRRRVEMRKIMNLRTNILGGTQEILAHPENCKLHFSADRWEAFKKDIAFFRQRHGVKRWEEAQTDHGYNGTPVWNIVGTTLANTGPATEDQIWWLTHIDPLFIIGITLMTWWAFGWRTTCVALAVFATNFPSRFYWTGGAYLRWDWLFYLVGGICLMRKNHPMIGGFFLGYSTLLRIFPLFTFVGPALAIFRQLWGTAGSPGRAAGDDRAGHDGDGKEKGQAAADKEDVKAEEKGGEKAAAKEVAAADARADGDPTRPWWKPQPLAPGEKLWSRLDRRYLSLVAGGALALVVLVPLSLVTSSGVSGYRAFVQNTEKHKETPLTNYMGLRTVVAFKPSEVGRVLRSDRLEDPWGAWKRAKLRTFHERKVFYALAVGGFLVLLWFATRGVEPWVACSMGAMMIAVGVELTCYYYAFLWAVALLYEKRREAGAILLAVTGVTGFIDWSPTRYLPQTRAWENLRMPTWLDEIYFWMSVATLVGFIWILYRFGFLPKQPALAVEGSPSSRGEEDDAGGRAAGAAPAPVSAGAKHGKSSGAAKSKSKSSSSAPSRRRK